MDGTLPDLDEADETSLLDRGMGLVRAIGHQTTVDVSVLYLRIKFL
jgi:hypothetical protein